MLVKFWLGFLGLCFGIVVASGAAAFIISLGIVPRYAQITRTAKRVQLYEDCSMLGAFVGNVLFLYSGRVSLGNMGLAVYGIFAGMFLGSWIIALGEVVNIYSIMARRIGITRGIGWIIIVMAVGKTLGSLFFFWKGW